MILAWDNPSLRIGIIIVIALMTFSVVGKLVLVDPLEQNLREANLPPGSRGHILGTDPLGRDILSWIASSIQTALLVSLSVVVLAALIGVVVGVISGYFGGLSDDILMRLVDLWLAVPPLLLFLAASAVIRPAIVSLILLIAVVAWVPYARLVRARVQSDRSRAYIAAARLAGASGSRILTVHLLPSAATLILVLASLQVGYVLLWESGLSFLGFGVQPPQTSLGYMIAQGRGLLENAWWIVTFPGVTIVLLVLAANLIGDGLRDVFHLDMEPRA